MKFKHRLAVLVFLVSFSIIGISSWKIWTVYNTDSAEKFNGNRALSDVNTMVSFGPRIPDSQAHKQTIEFIQKELRNNGWSSNVLTQVLNGHTALNILATRDNIEPILLLGAHYDSRIIADNDPIAKNRKLPVPGANDGASGVALLLEIARSLPGDSIPTALLFIDIEDNGRIPGWDWIQGSQAFAANMDIKPQAVIIVDMIGDSDLNIYMEKNSDVELTDQLWKTAKKLGYESSFIPKFVHRVLDDHIPFINKGIRAVDIIDLDYPYWHTLQDTPDKVSASSLQIVGDTLLAWIRDYGPCLISIKCSPE